jgi:hypothetical protein
MLVTTLRAATSRVQNELWGSIRIWRLRKKRDAPLRLLAWPKIEGNFQKKIEKPLGKVWRHADGKELAGQQQFSKPIITLLRERFHALETTEVATAIVINDKTEFPLHHAHSLMFHLRLLSEGRR